MASRYVPVFEANGPTGTAQQPGASPEAFGAAVGRGIEDIGEGAQQLHAAHQEVARQVSAADAGVKLANLSGEMDETIANARVNALPGAAGHKDVVLQNFDARAEQVRAQYTDPKVRRTVDQNLASMRARIQGSEATFEIEHRVDKQVQDFDDQGTTLATGAAVDPSPARLADALGQIDHIAELAIPPALRDKAAREQRGKVAVAWGEALATSNPKALQQLLSTETIAGPDGTPQTNPLVANLTGPQIIALKSRADVELRRQDAEARAQLAHDREQVAARVSLLRDKVKDGYIPTEAEFGSIEADASRVNLPKDQYDIHSMREEAFWTRQSQPWTAAQFDAEINRLEAIPLEKRTPEQAHELQWLGQKVGQRRAEPVDQDMARIGRPAPPINWHDPATLDARAAWAAAAHARHPDKPVPYLTADEIGAVKQSLEEGPQAQLETIGMLGRFGAGAAADIVRQIAPSNRALVRATGLPLDNAREAILGASRLQATPTLWDETSAREINNEIAAGVPEDLREDVFAAAKNIYGYRAATHTTEWNEGDYRMAVQRAMSAQGSGSNMKGGLQEHNGKLTWLPPSMTKDEFETTLARATPQQLVAAAGGHTPFWGDHSKVSLGDVRKLGMVPAYDDSGHVQPGIYYLQSPLGGMLHDNAGRPWRLDITKIK